MERWKKGEEEEGVRDIDRYREQRKESRCGLWAETAESPRLFSLLYRIVNLEHFLWSQTQSACRDKRQRTTAKREDTEEKPTKERRADKQERAQTSRGSDKREIPKYPPSPFVYPPVGADITLKGPGGHCLFLHPSHRLGSVT